jgi:hypothetical protein
MIKSQGQRRTFVAVFHGTPVDIDSLCLSRGFKRRENSGYPIAFVVARTLEQQKYCVSLDRRAFFVLENTASTPRQLLSSSLSNWTSNRFSLVAIIKVCLTDCGHAI